MKQWARLLPHFSGAPPALVTWPRTSEMNTVKVSHSRREIAGSG